MKKKWIAILICFIVIFALGFAFFSSDIGAEFLENYAQNFKVNVGHIAEKFNIELPQKWQQAIDEAEEEEEVPKTEYDRLKKEYEEQQKEEEKQKAEEEEETDKQSKRDNDEYSEKTVTHSGKNIAEENASSSRYERYKGGIVSASETKLTYYSAGGDKKWTQSVQVSSPVLKVAGDYILLFEKSGNKVLLYNGSKKIYVKKMDNTVKNCSVSSNGDVSVVYDRNTYKGSVSVYNKSGDEVYLWNSGKYSIIDSSISDSRRLAIALMDTSSGIVSKVYFFDIAKSGVDASFDAEDSIIFDIEYDGDVLNAFADDKIMGISQNGNLKWTYDSKDKSIIRYAISSGGTKLVAFDNNNASEIALISAGGDEKHMIKTEVIPDVTDIYDNKILYNDGRMLLLSRVSGDVLSQYKCSRDIKKAYIIDSDNIFIVYNSSIEFLNLKGE